MRPSAPPSSRRSLALLRSWTCPSCAQAINSSPRTALRNASTSPAKHQYAAPRMSQMRSTQTKKNQTALYYSLSGVIATIALSYGSVPMYKMVCQQTGWGGQPVRTPTSTSSTSSDPADRLIPVSDATRIRITFRGSTSDILPWRFVPQQREVRIVPGESALAFYKAKNMSDSDIIGVATYSVAPAQVAPYFSKIQCFCFEEQRLNAGEEVDMPVLFYIDKDFLTDPQMKGIETVTLAYNFFRAKYDDNGKLTAVPQAP